MKRFMVVSFVLILALVHLTTAQAGSYNLFGTGCRYDPSNDDDGLGIGFHTGDPDYYSAEQYSTEDAAGRWNAAMVPDFTIVSYGSSSRDLRVEWRVMAGSVGAVLSYWCGSSYYTQDPLFEWNPLQTYYVDDGPHRTAVAVHEIGHSYGVDHNNTGGCNGATAGLMYSDAAGKYDSCSWINPTTDDVNGAVDAHNG